MSVTQAGGVALIEVAAANHNGRTSVRNGSAYAKLERDGFITRQADGWWLTGQGMEVPEVILRKAQWDEEIAAVKAAKVPSPKKVGPMASTPVEGDYVYRESDGSQGKVEDITRHGRLVVAFVDGTEWSVHWDVLAGQGYERITADEYAEGVKAAEAAEAESAVEMILERGTFNDPYDLFAEDIQKGTGTLVKPHLRACLARRKRKATKRARARVGGGW